MKRLIGIIVLLGILALAYAAAAELPEGQGVSPAASGLGTTQPTDSHGLLMLVKPDRSVINSGESLVVTVTVQNRGPTKAKVWYSDYQLVQGISVFAADGTPAPPTYTRSHRMLHRMDVGHAIARDLEPGAQTSSRPVITSCFDLTEPGRYTIRAKAQVSVHNVRSWVEVSGETTVEVQFPANAPYGPAEPIPKGGDAATRNE